MRKLLWILIYIYLSIFQSGYGYLENMLTTTIITQQCCDMGFNHGRNQSSGDCSSPVTPKVPSAARYQCLFVMDQCCKEYMQIRPDCRSDIDIAISTNSCQNTNDTLECCYQCLIGMAWSRARKPDEACRAPFRGITAAQVLAGDAFKHCCQEIKLLNIRKASNSSNPRRPKQWRSLDEQPKCAAGFKYGSFGECFAYPPLRDVFFDREKNADDRDVTTKCPWGYKIGEEDKCQVYPPLFDEFYNVGKKTCLPGYKLGEKYTCDDINECSMDGACGLIQSCINHLGTYSCHCPNGFRQIGERDCEDVDECASFDEEPVCSENSICINTVGSYNCQCLPGFIAVLNDDKVCVKSVNCTDVTLCQQQCHNVWGGYQCSCHKGYKLNPDNRTCSDIDECESKDLCPESQICVNEPGNYRCSFCITGFQESSDNTSCIDIDECSTGTAKCGPTQICSNFPGGYSCSCPTGHRLVRDHMCEDVDECAVTDELQITKCPPNADCVNTVGSYQCQCHKGFESRHNTDNVCVDVDECVATIHGILCQQKCINTLGDYHCSCHQGYSLNPDNKTCSDIDECTQNVCVGLCLNVHGGYRCSCPAGYNLSTDKRTCIDIDECGTGVATCAKTSYNDDTNEICLNTRGGYRCYRIICPVGYSESNARCTKIGECAPSDWNCPQHPKTISHNFISFVSNISLPDKKPLKLFSMKGPNYEDYLTNFDLKFITAVAPPNVLKATLGAFLLQQTDLTAILLLVRPLEGPQDIELEISMELRYKYILRRKAVSRLYIHVSEYNF